MPVLIVVVALLFLLRGEEKFLLAVAILIYLWGCPAHAMPLTPELTIDVQQADQMARAIDPFTGKMSDLDAHVCYQALLSRDINPVHQCDEFPCQTC